MQGFLFSVGPGYSAHHGRAQSVYHQTINIDVLCITQLQICISLEIIMNILFYTHFLFHMPTPKDTSVLM